MKTKQKKTLGRLLALLLTAAMLATAPDTAALAAATAETAAEPEKAASDSPANQVHHCTKQNDGTDRK